MISKIGIAVALFAVVQAGHEAPPPKAHSYSVPSVAKVSYPAPTVHKTVETYSAPSIEKTTTITRTITAPLNAPAVKSIQYSAPAAPVHKAALAPGIYAAPSFASHGLGQFAYAAPAYSHGHGHQAVYGAPAVALAPSHGYQQPLLASYAVPHGIRLATTYGNPSVGYNLGHLAGHHDHGHAHVAKAVEVSSDYGH